MRRLAFSALLLVGCARDRATADPGTDATTASAPHCAAVGELADLGFALAGGTTPPTRVGAQPLARADEELAYLDLALNELDAREDLATTLSDLRDAMVEHRAEVAGRTTEAGTSFAAAKRALEDAAWCSGVDMRREAQGKDKRAVESKRCLSSVRLWSALRRADLTSAVSSRSAATHAQELTLDPDRTQMRDRISERLMAHASNLQQLELAIDFGPSHETPSKRALSLARIDAAERIAVARVQCLEQIAPSERVLAKGAAPRDATVVVRPKWPTAVKEAGPTRGSFGSGFVVRWRGKDGATETRIVTNHHVMDGAIEAEIIPGSEAGKRRTGKDDEPRIVARLVKSVPRDDIAILRLDASPRARELLSAGIGFRLSPAREEEKVIAAGFPGVSGSPSFQVTEGIVSNAKFRAAEHDRNGVAAYIQHTAPIDPGNSGGPLLDARGRLLGMNALKIFGRENVGLAIPTARIQLAMARADERPHYNRRHAEAACNMAVAALASFAPKIQETERFGLPLHDAFDSWSRSPNAVRHRERVAGEPLSALELVRTRLYAGLKASLDAEGGVAAYTTCSDIARATSDAGPPRFVGSFRTTTQEHEIVLAEEGGSLRVVSVALP